MIIFLLLIIVLCAPPSWAQSEPDLQTACAALSARTVKGAAYEPGLDVYGRPVVEADVPPDLRAGVSMRLKLDEKLLSRLGIPMPHNLPGELDFGELEIRGQQVFYQGQPLSPESRKRLDVLCLEPDAKSP